MAKNRRLGFLVYILLLLSGPVAVLSNTHLQALSQNEIVFINFFQRCFGTMAYVALFVQIF